MGISQSNSSSPEGRLSPQLVAELQRRATEAAEARPPPPPTEPLPMWAHKWYKLTRPAPLKAWVWKDFLAKRKAPKAPGNIPRWAIAEYLEKNQKKNG